MSFGEEKGSHFESYTCSGVLAVLELRSRGRNNGSTGEEKFPLCAARATTLFAVDSNHKLEAGSLAWLFAFSLEAQCMKAL